MKTNIQFLLILKKNIILLKALNRLKNICDIVQRKKQIWPNISSCDLFNNNRTCILTLRIKSNT